jgi:hypothetical protein
MRDQLSLFSPDQASPTRNSIASGYRSLAARCKREAGQAKNQEFRDQYLSLAERWDARAAEMERTYWPI